MRGFTYMDRMLNQDEVDAILGEQPNETKEISNTNELEDNEILNILLDMCNNKEWIDEYVRK